jgi:hypothetical protein
MVERTKNDPLPVALGLTVLRHVCRSQRFVVSTTKIQGEILSEGHVEFG